MHAIRFHGSGSSPLTVLFCTNAPRQAQTGRQTGEQLDTPFYSSVLMFHYFFPSSENENESKKNDF